MGEFEEIQGSFGLQNSFKLRKCVLFLVNWRGHTTNSALHRETHKTYVARLQFYTPCDNILKVLLTEIP